MTGGEEAGRSSNHVVAGRPTRVDHEAGLRPPIQAEFLDHPREDEVCLVRKAVQIRNEHDCVDIRGGHLRVFQRAKRYLSEVSNEVAVGVSPGRQLADSDEYGVIGRFCINV